MRHGDLHGPLVADSCECHDICRCPGEEEWCDHEAYTFEDDGTKVCANEDCLATLDEDDD